MVTALNKPDPPSSHIYQMPIVPKLVVGFHTTPSLSWHFIWLELTQILGLLLLLVRIHKRNGPAVSRKQRFLDVLHGVWLLQSFHPLFHNDAWALWEGHDGMYFPFRVGHFSISYFLYVGQLRVCVHCCVMQGEASLIVFEMHWSIAITQ